jgi:hypothetical protein
MRFISNGDFIFPFSFPAYWAEHFYTWSYQQGATNPEGIMRLPGRLLDLIVFAAFGNVAASYFFLTSSLVIATLGFFWFAKSVLGVRRWSAAALGALFFAFNPIFLGNLSKVGLVLAVAMLPIALASLKQGFEQKRFSYLLLFIVALNISLIHPFTFSVNLIVAGIYLIYLVRKHRVWVWDRLGKLLFIVAIGLLLNAYLILPLISLGTVDKSALTDTISSAPADYTSLVDIANTGDIFTALSLSKGVLKDYEFYGAMTWPFYFLGVFAFYALLFWLYVRVEKRAKPFDRRRIVLSLSVFLALLALSTASYLYADTLIKLLIDLPAGWMFRSPLKWQLYMPLALFTALVVCLKYVEDSYTRRMFYVGFGITFVLMNGYLFTQVSERLLRPRTLTYFSNLEKIDMDNKNLLFVNSQACMSVARDYPALATELNQVLISKAVQVKRILSGNLGNINLATYDFVLGCTGTVNEETIARDYHFEPAGQFAENIYRLYRNTEPRPYITTASQVFRLGEAEGLGGKNAFTTQTLGQAFNFVTDANDHPNVPLQNLFEDLTINNVQQGLLHTKLKPLSSGRHRLYIPSDSPLYAQVHDTTIAVSTMPQKGSQPVPSMLDVNLSAGESLDFTYDDPAFSYQNRIANPSLEEGLWQKEVGDCNAYDDQPSIVMKLVKQQVSDGAQALQLQASQHIACTGPAEIPVKAGEHYALSFDYQSLGDDEAGYSVNFDDNLASSISERLPASEGWATANKHVVVPQGATHLRLVVYGYPSENPGTPGTARYDRFSLIQIPEVKDHLFLVSNAAAAATPPTVAFTKHNPTKTLLQITGAREPFYLTAKESYHHLWRLRLDDGRSGLAGLLTQTPEVPSHLIFNGSQNGWYIDPAALCQTANAGCAKQADGSYDIALVMEFTPQRWFYIGLIISLAAAAGAITFAIFEVRRAREQRGGAS